MDFRGMSKVIGGYIFGSRKPVRLYTTETLPYTKSGHANRNVIIVEASLAVALWYTTTVHDCA